MAAKVDKSELKLLRDKCLLFNQFMMERTGTPVEMVSAYAESSRAVEECYQKGFAKGLKAANIDIDEMVTRHMPVAMADDIKLLFKEKLGIDYSILDKRRAKTIENIIKRGKIKNKEEYELVINRVDEIYPDAEKTAELNQLNGILTLFEKFGFK